MNWDLELEKLKQYVFENNYSYEKIGRMYNCSGTTIKKALIKRRILLPIRSSNTGKIPWNKNKSKKYYCLNCGKELNKTKNTYHKYCSNHCEQEHHYKQWVNKYKVDNSIAKSTKWGQIPSPLKRYIFDKYENKCCICGWSEINPYTNTLPLEIDHIDGNSENNSEENLRLICPNCHSLTSTYRDANRGKGRNITWILKPKENYLEETNNNDS